MTKCDFNKLALQHRFLRTAFSKNTYGWLLLKMGVLILVIIDHSRKLRDFFVSSLNGLSQIFASRLFLIQSSQYRF